MGVRVFFCPLRERRSSGDNGYGDKTLAMKKKIKLTGFPVFLSLYVCIA